MRTHKEVIEDLHKTVGADPWAEHPRFPREEWKLEVFLDGTVLSYRDWLYNQLMEEGYESD